MTPFDQAIIKERTQGATTEEKVWMASCLPTDILENELTRRNSKAISVLNNLIEVVCTASNDMSLQDMEKLIKTIKDIARGKKTKVEEETKEQTNLVDQLKETAQEVENVSTDVSNE